MVIAKSYQASNETEQAASYYRTVISLGKSEFAAEARYQLAYILFQQNKLMKLKKPLLKWSTKPVRMSSGLLKLTFC